jgi:hypothetical protein
MKEIRTRASLHFRGWPVGPEYRHLAAAGAKNGRPWTEFKLWSAEWYLHTLETLHDRSGELSQFVGEEMALDGYLAAVSSAFDAATYGLIRAIEDARHVPEPQRTPEYLINWSKAIILAATAPVAILQCGAAVSTALAAANTPQPGGWLAQARHLRNRSTHMNSLARAHFMPHQPTQLRVPGIGDVAPMPYLTGLLPQIRTLTSSVLADADAINP